MVRFESSISKSTVSSLDVFCLGLLHWTKPPGSSYEFSGHISRKTQFLS